MRTETFESKFQVHYYFTDKERHSMDAFLLVDTQKEMLAIIKDVCDQLEISIVIESESLKDGGLREVWKFLGDNSKQLTVVTGLLTLLLTGVVTYTSLAPKKLSKEEQEYYKQQNEISKIEKKLKEIELQEKYQENQDKFRDKVIELKNSITDDDTSNKVVIDSLATQFLEKDHRVKFHRSNFYKKLNGYKPIESVGASILDKNNKPVGKEQTVPKHRFKEFILPSNDLEPETDEEALIEIISPVLKYGTYKWKGIYQGQEIVFKMTDEKFKLRVANKEVEFSNGFMIKCILNQKREIAEDGSIKIKSTTVTEVLEEITDSGVHLTVVGRRKLRAKRMLGAQLGLPF